MKEYNSVLIIYNPSAKKGKVDGYIPYIKQRLSFRYEKVDGVASPSEKTAEELAQKNAGKYDIIVACGGDGTVHSVINGVMKSGESPLVGILPFGTCNDLARTLHIPFDLDRAIDCILRLNKTNYDLMFDGKNYAIYALATGYLTQVSFDTSSKLKKRFGRFAYFLSGIKSFFRFKSLPLTVTSDNERINGKFTYFMLVNGESTGGFRLNKGEDLSNLKVKMVLLKKGRFLSGWFTFMKMFLFGINSIKKSKNAIIKDVSEVEIENPSNERFTIDGECERFLKKSVAVSGTLTLIKF